MTLKSHDLAHIRTVVLAGHAGGGKTTLAEQVLFRAGSIPRLGRVDDGTAHLDYEPEEQKRHQTLSLAVGTFDHGDHEITVMDRYGVRSTIPCDSVVIAVGFRPNRELIEKLKKNASVQICEVGDCIRPRKIFDAIHEGHLAAKLLA